MKTASATARASEEVAVSVLYREPKVLKQYTQIVKKRAVSVLYREPKKY